MHQCARLYVLEKRFFVWALRKSMEVGNAFHKLQELSVTIPHEDVMMAFYKWSVGQINRVADQETRDAMSECHAKGKAVWLGYQDLLGAGYGEPRTRTVLSAEHRFLVELESVIVPGRIDQIALIANPWYGDKSARAIKPDSETLLAVIDYKTTSKDIGAYVEDLVTSNQGPLYLHWAQTSAAFAEDFPEIAAEHGRPDVVVFDVVRVPAIRLKKKEAPEEFFDRVRADMVAEGRDHFLRYVYAPSAANISDTLKTFETSAKIWNIYYESNFWPKCDACGAVNYNQSCPQLQQCMQMTEGRLDRIKREELRPEEDEDE